jgi:hypothetical protein
MDDELGYFFLKSLVLQGSLRRGYIDVVKCAIQPISSLMYCIHPDGVPFFCLSNMILSSTK